jgi:hypothetical protein
MVGTQLTRISLSVRALFFALLVLAVGCKAETFGELGAPAQEAGAAVAVTVTGLTGERLEIDGKDGPLVYSAPVIAIAISFENKGETNFLYKPTHNQAKTSNLEAPILYRDPGPEAELRASVDGVFLEGVFAAGQQEEVVDLKPGESVKDVYLFKMPEEEKLGLVLTIPPDLHGGKGLIKIKIPYEKPAVQEVQVSGQGEEVKLGSATVTVSAGETLYLDLMENKTKGFSKEPVYKVVYSIRNDGSEAINYEPNHTASGSALAASLIADGEKGGNYMRVRFSADRDVVGQTGRRQAIAPGTTHKDFAIFERPPEGVEAVRFTLPGKLFGQPGLLRVRLPYKAETPKKPPGN